MEEAFKYSLKVIKYPYILERSSRKTKVIQFKQ